MYIYGLQPGTYTLQRWSTTDTNPATRIKSSTSVTVGTNGRATVSVSIGLSDVGWAYKLVKQGT